MGGAARHLEGFLRALERARAGQGSAYAVIGQERFPRQAVWKEFLAGRVS